MVKITVIQCTKRENPHFEQAIKSLMTQNFKDFEYIIIDSLHSGRSKNVEKLIDSINVDFPIKYMRDKPSRWESKRPALCNARNTGLIFANGEYIVFHDDNCKMPSDWLEKHLYWLEQGYLVAGNWMSFQSTDNNGKGIVGLFGWEHRSKIVKEPKITSGTWLYGGNFSFPLHVAENINGFDELYDGEMGQDDIDFGIRAERKGYKIMYDPSCYLEYYYSDHGLLMNYQASSQKMVGINIAPVNIVLNDGIEHFSNEFLMQELISDTNRYTTRGNNFNIKNMRKIASENNIDTMYNTMENFISTNENDWRDGKPVSKK